MEIAYLQLMHTAGLLFAGNKEKYISTLEALKCMVSLWPLMRASGVPVLYRKYLDFSPAFLQGPKRKGEFAAYVV